MLQETQKQFIEHLQTQHKANATIVAYGKDIDQLILYLEGIGKTDFKQVTKEDLEGFLASLKTQNFTPKTISRKTNSIKTFYKFLLSNKFVTDNPASALTHPRYELKEPRILTKMEYRALRDVCRSDVRTYAIVELFLQTGMRISEVADLSFNQLQEDFIDLQGRKIPVNQSADEALKKYLTIRPQLDPNGHVFITKSGKPLLVRNIRTAVDRALKTAGVENAKVNDLRVTFIAYQLAAGAPLEYISKLVGHKRISTTERYLNIVKEKPKKGAKLVEL
jgi:site-specific recombinase XerD